MSDIGGGTSLGTATFYITGNTSGATNAVNSFQGALGQLERATAQNWWGIRNLGFAFAALPAAVGAGVSAAIAAAVQWQDAMAGVERTTQATGQGLSDLEDDLLALGRVKPIATVEIAGIAEAGGALGVATGDLKEFTGVIVDLAATTDLTADTASTNIARIAGMTGVAGAGFDNLASSVLEAGRQTAATETDIVNLSNRIAGIAGVVGLSADEVVGLAAATRSAGVQTEAGGTAIQKTFVDLKTAISENGDALETWAALAGQTTEQFKTSFQANAAGAFLSVIQGLGNLNAQGVDTIGILDSVGVSEQRQIRTLLSLAKAQNQNVNSNLKLSTILGITNDAFDEGTALADIAGRRYQTVAAQIQILKNQLFEAGNALGQMFLPALSFVIKGIGYFLTGIRTMPSGIRVVVGAFIGLTTVVSGFLAMLLLVGPRIIIAVGALRQLQQAAGGAPAGFAAYTSGAANAATVTDMYTMALGRNIAALRAQQSMLGVANIFSVMAGQGVQGVQVLGRFEQGLGTAATGWSKWGSRAGKALGAVGIAMTALSVITTIFGAKQAQAAAKQEELVQADEALTDSLREGGSAAQAAGNKWIEQKIKAEHLMVAAINLGISLRTLRSIIAGTASDKTYESFIKRVTKAHNDGDESATRLGMGVINLRKQYQASVDESGALIGANGQMIDVNEELADSWKDVGESADDARSKLEDMARAHIDFVSAQFDLLEANFALADAERELAKARSEAADNQRKILQAELELRQARRAQIAAGRDLEQAEEDLSHARADAAENVRVAELDLADARQRARDITESIRKKEEELAELRRGPEIDEIRKATLELAKAEDRLGDAHQSVADAEWQLNYLRQEGASQRDIKDAEEVLSDARLDVRDAAQEVTDAEKELAELRDGTERQRKIKELEADIAAARRDSARQLIEIQNKEQALADLRERVAEDTDYQEAQDRVIDAQLRVQDAIDSTKDAELELANIRAGVLSEDAQKASLDYEQALFNVASAHAEARKQALLMKGVEVDAGDEARLLAEELGKVAAMAPSEEARKRLAGFVNVLRGAPDVPAKGKGGGGGGNVPDIGDMGTPDPTAFDDINNALDDLQGNIEETPSLLDFIFGGFGGREGIGGAAGGAIGGIIGSALGGPIGAIVGGILGTIVGSLVGKFWPQISEGLSAGIGWIKDHWQAILLAVFTPAGIFAAVAGIGRLIILGIENGIRPLWRFMQNLGGWILDYLNMGWPDFDEIGEDIIGGLVAGLKGAWNLLTAGLRWLWDNFIKGIKDLFGISSPSTKMAEVGKDLIRGLVNGILALPGIIWNAIVWVKDQLFAALSGAGQWLFDIGKSILRGAFNGIKDKAVDVKDWFGKLPGKIWEWMGTLGELERKLFRKGVAFITGLWRGVKDKAVDVKDWFGKLPGKIWDWIGTLGELERKLIRKGLALLGGFFTGVKNKALDVADWFGKLPGKVWDWLGTIGELERKLARKGLALIGGLWTGMKDKWKSVAGWLGDLPGKVATKVSGLFDGLKDAFKNAINWIIDAWNNLDIKIDVSLPKWIPKIGGKGFKIDDIFPDIPRLAEGGFLRRPGWVQVGEAGPELLSLPAGATVVPLPAIRSIMESLRSDVNKMVIDSLLRDSAAQFGAAQMGKGQVTINNDYSQFNLQAITTADPAEIINEYVWSRKVGRR